MRKRERFRRWMSMLLTVIILFNQMPVTMADDESAYTQEEAGGLTTEQSVNTEATVLENAGADLGAENQEQTQTEASVNTETACGNETADAAGTEAAETPAAETDKAVENTSSDAQQEITPESAADPVYEEELIIDGSPVNEIPLTAEMPVMETTAQIFPDAYNVDVSAQMNAEKIAANTYKVHIDWQVNGAEEKTTALALGMDKFTYESLIESARADENGVCRIPCGEEKTISMKKETDPSDPQQILLIYMQEGDGTLSLDIELAAADAAETQNSILAAKWYHEENGWETAAQTELAWEKSLAVPETESETAEQSESTAPETESETPEQSESTAASENEDAEQSESAAMTESESPEQSESVPETEPVSESESDIATAESETETDTEEAGKVATEPETEQNGMYSAGASADAEGMTAAVFSNGPRRARARGAEADSIDMSNYITSASFAPSEIEEGDLVQLSIGYKIQSATLTNAGTNKLTYQLPDGIAPFETASGTVFNKNREAVGRYEITADGAITITFNDTFVTSGNSITGEIHFWTLLSAEGDGEEHEYKFSESNQITAKIKINQVQTESGGETEKKTDLYVKKDAVAFDKDNQTASYEIVIGTNNGSNGEISFKDDFSEAKDSSGHTVTGEISSETETLIKKDSTGNETTLNFNDYFNTANGDITLKEGKTLPQLEKGEQYIIKYNMQFSGISNMNGEVSLSNSASAWDKRSNPSDGEDIKFNHTYIKKSSAYDSKADKIFWQIDINDFGADLNGLILNDILKRNGADMSLPEKVTMLEYLDDGSVKESQISIPFTFDANKVTNTKHKFVIKYTTDVSKDGFYTEYRNTAMIGDHTSGENGQDIKHDNGVLTKNYEKPEEEAEIKLEKVDDNTRCYLWNVVITPPSDGIKAGSYYHDTMSATNQQNQGMSGIHRITADQLSNLTVKYKDAIKGDVKSSAYEKQVKVNDQWVVFNEQKGPFDEFRIMFKEPIAAGESIVLSYRTTADITTMTEGNVWNFTNTGAFYQDNGSTQDSDITKESKGGYLKKTGMFMNNSTGSVELGGDGNTKVYDECKGILYYNITVNETQTMKLGDGEIVIKDILPEGTTLYKKPYSLNAFATSDRVNDSIVKFFWNSNQSSGMYDVASGTVNGKYDVWNIDKLASWSYDEQTREITIRIPDYVYAFVNNEANTSRIVRVFYAAQITDALGKGEEKTYKNEAKLYLDGTEKATDSVTDKVISSYISKTHESTDAENEASYRVLVNPTGAQLAGGSTLTLVDTLDYTKHTVAYGNKTVQYINSVSLKPNTFHLYNLNADGSKGSEISTSLYTVRYGENEDRTKFEMKIQIPDETPCVLEYTYKFSVNEAALKAAGKESYDVVNDINLSGSYTDESGDNSQIKLQDSGATADTDNLLLTKVDENNQVIYLKGAVFQLQKYEKVNDNWEDDANWQNVKIYVTGEDGTASLAGLTERVPYRLVEIEAPTNYSKNETPQYFYVGTAPAEPSEFLTAATKHNTTTGTIVVTNPKSDSENTSVAVQKKWVDAKESELDLEHIVDENGKQIESIEISLYQKTDPNAPISETDTAFRTAWFSHDDNNNWFYSFNNLPKSDESGNRYYYYVKETGKAKTASGEEIQLNGNYELLLDMTEGVRGGTVDLTNKKKPGKTQVTVKKNWPEGRDTVPVPVTLYKSGTAPKATVSEKKMVNYTVKLFNKNGVNNESFSTQTVEVDAEGSSVKIALTMSKDNAWLDIQKEARYQLGTDSCEHLVTGTVTNNGTNIVATYILENVTQDIILNVQCNTNYVSTANFTSCTAEAIFTGNTKNLMELPADCKPISVVTLGAANNSVSVDGKTISTTEWNYTWKNLEDNYYYYAQEGTEATPGYIDGYIADYSYTYWEGSNNTQLKEVAITNTPTISPTETSITAQKKWMIKGTDGSWTEVTDISASNQKLPGSITFGLYRSTTQNDPNPSLVEKQTVTAAEGWAHTWTGLQKTTNSDGTGDPYYYYVKEEIGTLGTYSPEIDHTEGITRGTITATNKITSITVNKSWLAADGIELAADERPQGIAVQLYRTDAPGYNYAVTVDTQKTLNAENNWSYTWQGLPEGTYYVQEITTPKGFVASYQTDAQKTANESKSSADQSAVTGGNIHITNKKGATGLTVLKKWGDESGNKPNVKVKLYRTTEAPEGVTPADQSSNMTVSLALNWKESDGTASATLPSTGSCDVTFSGNNETYTATLSASSGWEGSVTLPATTADGTALVYTVTYPVEIQIDSTLSATVTSEASTVSGANGDQRLQLTAVKKEAGGGNAKTFTVKVVGWKKNWQDTDVPSLKEGAYLDVYIHSSATEYQRIHETPLRLQAPDWSAKYTCPDVNDTATYYVEQGDIQSNVGLTVARKENITGAGQIDVWIGYDDSALAATDTAKASIAPVTETYTTAANMTGGSETYALTNTETLTLNIGGKDVTINNAEYMGTAFDKTLNSGNNWTDTWSNLDKTDKDGNLYYYYAVEEPVTGYNVSYEITYVEGDASKGIESVQITNTKDENAKTSITVQKNWNGDIVNGAVYTAQVTLHNSDGTIVNTTNNPATLTGTQDSHTWSELPLGGYYVTEDSAKCNGESVSNCTTTYQAADGEKVTQGNQAITTGETITITNTVTKQGITLPGTGSKYPLVFYGLGSAFLLISAAWLLLTFKKKNIPIKIEEGGRRSNK